MSGGGEGGGYFIRDRNRVSGPFDIDTLKRFARNQRLARHHQLSADRITWVKAVELLPEVFVANVPVPQRPTADLTLPPIEDAAMPLEEPATYAVAVDAPAGQRRADVPWGLIFGLTAVVGGGGAVAFLVWLTLGLADPRWSKRDVQAHFSPMLTVVRGMKPKTGKASCYGVVVSRHHVVVPLEAAFYRTPKVEVPTPEGDREWRSANLVLFDLVSKLAVLRADLGQAENALDPPDRRDLPSRDDKLYVVSPDRRGVEVVCLAELDEVLERDEPDEVLLLSFEDELPVPEELLGRAVIDERGEFKGLVVGVSPDGRAMCTAGHEVSIKRDEAKKVPKDLVLAPLDEEDLAGGTPDAEGDTTAPESPDGRAPGRGRQRPPPEEEDPAPDAGSEDAPPEGSDEPQPDEPASDEPSGARRPAADDGAAMPGGRDLIATVGEAGANLVSGATDALTPRLADRDAEILGRNHLAKILDRHPRCNDARLTERVERICAEMLRAADEDPGRYTVTVVEDDTLNAYAFVGRNLVVTTGFMDFVGRDDDMVRFVLAHEIGHVVLGHADEPYRRLVGVKGLVPGGGLAADFAQSIFKNSPMNQSQERAADCFAVRCLRRTGRPIDGGVRFFEKLASTGDDNATDDVVGALFASHPDSRARVDHIRNGCDRDDE